MKFLFPARPILSLALGVAVLGLHAGCATTSSEKVDLEQTIKYKTVDEGELTVMNGEEPWSVEKFTIEQGSDGLWIASASVAPQGNNQNTRETRLELDSALKPVNYSEEATGTSPLKVFITFQSDKATLTVVQGDSAERNQPLEGSFDVLMTEYLLGDPKQALFHLTSMAVRAHLAQNAAKSELKVMGANSLITEELERSTLAGGANPVPVRHFVMDTTGGKQPNHVWINADDLTLIKVETVKRVRGNNFKTMMSATKVGVVGGEALTASTKEATVPTEPAPAAVP